MTLEIVSAEQIARSFALVASDGLASRRGLAQIFRSLSLRQGMATRQRLLRYAREQIAAAGLGAELPPESAGEVLDQLHAQGDYQRATVGHQVYAVPSIPRWMAIGGGRAALVGIAELPPSLRLWTGDDRGDLVRRCDIQGEDAHAALRLGGFSAASWEDWLSPLGYVAHMVRRTDMPIRSDLQSLSSFWALLVESVTRDGDMLSSEAQVRYLTGQRGTFFGRKDSLECEGRWSGSADDGVWCAYRKGFGEAHWHPAIVAVDGEDRRSIDLYDGDEWAWAVLAKGETEARREVVNRSGDRLSVSFPLPQQLFSAMDLLGRRIKAWEWEIAADAPDIWALIR